MDELGVAEEARAASSRRPPRTCARCCEAFKTQDPNGNGKADEIPLSASAGNSLIPYFMNAFIYDPQGTSDANNNASTLVLKDGKVDLQANKDGWREGLRYINSLYKEGLIDKGAFTQNPDALLQQGNHAGSVILGSAHRPALGSVRQHRLGRRPGQAVRRRTAADRAAGRELHRLQLPERAGRAPSC